MSFITRRRLIGSAAALGAALPALAHARLVPTPSATEGPVYPQSFPLDADSDLVQMAGGIGYARGQVAYLPGHHPHAAGKPTPGPGAKGSWKS